MIVSKIAGIPRYEFREFIEDIQVGDYSRIKRKLREEGSTDLLCQEYQWEVGLDKIVELEITTNEGDDEDEETCEGSGEPKLVLRPLQLAIVTGREEVITVILKHIIESNNAEQIMVLLKEQLGHKATINFPCGIDESTYDKDDRSLDGMNAFHLAAKYYPEGLQVIFDTLADEDGFYSNILPLLLEKDGHLQQTPLHVALRNPSSDSSEGARYKDMKDY